MNFHVTFCENTIKPTRTGKLKPERKPKEQPSKKVFCVWAIMFCGLSSDDLFYEKLNIPSGIFRLSADSDSILFPKVVDEASPPGGLPISDRCRQSETTQEYVY
jgi:hypothetical protein